MRFYSDLHIHSKYARACSPRLTLQEIYRWSRIKGVSVVATSDFTHPEWFKLIEEQLAEQDTGLLSLKDPFLKDIDQSIPQTCTTTPKFILSSEISLIYKKNEKVRKVHILILAPSLQTANKLNKKLSKIGNLKSDGRPILGLDSKDLLEIVMETDSRCTFIPAHIWTPWFSLFGDKSGFDSIEECFEELSHHIKAIETGLSSDPEMNWSIENLKGKSIISNSDAHSPENIARECNIFNCNLNYDEISHAIESNDETLVGTIEFYPHEGRYHYDGHRKCNIVCSPKESEKSNNICPKCNKRLTIGVLHRVFDLASGKISQKSKHNKEVHYTIPLREILSELLQKGKNTKTVEAEYFSLINRFGSELKIALEIPISEIKNHWMLLGTAIQKIREKDININPGFDGVYGEITIFSSRERKKIESLEQMHLI